MSITLTNAFTIAQGASQIENNTNSAAVQLQIDWQANVATLFMPPGVTAGSLFSPSPRLHVKVVRVDANTGNWVAQDDTGTTTGTLNGTQLTNFQAWMKARRNDVENSLLNWGIVSGSQVAW